MKPRYFLTETAGRDRWMISYMDVLTILLIFFVAIAAHGLPTLQKAAPSASPEAASKPVTPDSVGAKPAENDPAETTPASPTADAGAPSSLLRIKEKLAQRGLDLHIEPRGLVISLPQTVLFPPGEDKVGPEALPIVQEIASVLVDVPNKITLIGHADSVPIHNRRFRNNWELSAARGLRLLELLSGSFGIPEARLTVASEGSYEPKSPNDTPDGRANNRRVEIVIVDSPAASAVPAENVASVVSSASVVLPSVPPGVPPSQ
jgi:chemotaxis protein MotB